jgi:hypothetical protein
MALSYEPDGTLATEKTDAMGDRASEELMADGV